MHVECIITSIFTLVASDKFIAKGLEGRGRWKGVCTGKDFYLKLLGEKLLVASNMTPPKWILSFTFLFLSLQFIPCPDVPWNNLARRADLSVK